MSADRFDSCLELRCSCSILERIEDDDEQEHAHEMLAALRRARRPFALGFLFRQDFKGRVGGQEPGATNQFPPGAEIVSAS